MREGTLARTDFEQNMRPVRGEMLDRLREGSRGDAPKVAGRCREILKRQEALFTFISVTGVEPTHTEESAG